MNHKQIVFIVGPTGIGKSAVAIELAKRIDGEIVSADSMQMYRGMDIGTAKVTPEEQSKVVHHLLDIVDVNQPMDVALYREKALKEIELILSRDRIPFVVGGSGMYVRSLTDGLFEGPACNPDLRRELEALAEEKGNEALVEKLKKVDPVGAEKIDSNNRRRLIRALEVFEAEKKPMSELADQWSESTRSLLGYPFQLFGLTMDRPLLYERINQRVDQMFEQGLVEETKKLLEQGLEQNATALQAIGYKEVRAYIQGEITLSTCQEEVKKSTRHFAKRQWTWFRRDPRVEWVDVTPEQSIEERANILYNKIEGNVV